MSDNSTFGKGLTKVEQNKIQSWREKSAPALSRFKIYKCFLLGRLKKN
jgi:hypothetical protein